MCVVLSVSGILCCSLRASQRDGRQNYSPSLNGCLDVTFAHRRKLAAIFRTDCITSPTLIVCKCARTDARTDVRMRAACKFVFIRKYIGVCVNAAVRIGAACPPRHTTAMRKDEAERGSLLGPDPDTD